MPLGQLLISIASIRGAIGNPIRENLDLSDPLNYGDPLINSYSWVLNSSESSRTKENSDADLMRVKSPAEYYNSSTTNYPDTHNADSISIIWYLASFGTLVLFFLLISFSEVCCKKSFTDKPEEEPEVSPPPYDLFAPPAYDSLYPKKKEKNPRRKKLGKCEVFVIHVFGDKNTSPGTNTETVLRSSTIFGHR